MNTLIVFDSLYGSTKTIAETIGQQLNPQTTGVIPVSKMSKVDMISVDLLIVGSPVHGGNATPSIKDWLQSIPENSLRNKHIAAFDTRLEEKEQAFPLRVLMKIIQYAAPRISRVLTAKGGQLVTPPIGFIVTSKEGPLRIGETERAVAWTKNLLSLL